MSPQYVLVDGDEVTGVLGWSEAGQGDPLHDLATLTLGDEEHSPTSSRATAARSTST